MPTYPSQPCAEPTCNRQAFYRHASGVFKCSASHLTLFNGDLLRGEPTTPTTSTSTSTSKEN